MSNPFQDAYLSATDARNPYAPRTAFYELFELGRYYRQHVKVYEPIHRQGPGLYKGLRSGEVFQFHYNPLRIEAVQDVRLERSGRGR
jgi:hypothetical protein